MPEPQRIKVYIRCIHDQYLLGKFSFFNMTGMSVIKSIVISGWLLSISLMAQSGSLLKQWETDTLFSKPESAVYDPVCQLIYVSNINGKYCTHDGNGFISKVSLTGEIVELKWVDGLDSPQGMGLAGTSLFVADLDQLVEIDTRTGTIINHFPVPGALFLNDVAINDKNEVFMTDCKRNLIHRLKYGEVSTWLSDSVLKGPNGIFWDGPTLLLLNGGTQTLYKIDTFGKQLLPFCTGIRNGDGVVSDGEGGFFVSGAWQGELFHIDPDGRKTLLLDLGPQKTIVADITYIAEKKLLLIPTLSKTVLCYTWE